MITMGRMKKDKRNGYENLNKKWKKERGDEKDWQYLCWMRVSMIWMKKAQEMGMETNVVSSFAG